MKAARNTGYPAADYDPVLHGPHGDKPPWTLTPEQALQQLEWAWNRLTDEDVPRDLGWAVLDTLRAHNLKY